MAHTYIVSLRGINVTARESCGWQNCVCCASSVGLANVRTYIQSGNVICESALSEAALLKTLEAVLAK